MIDRLEELDDQLRLAKDWGSLLLNDVIAHDDDIEAPEPVMSVAAEDRHYEFMTLGNFSSIIGQAKSRKSFLATMLCAAALKGGHFQGALWSKKIEGEVVYVDTEQGNVHVQNLVRRVHVMAGSENFTCYALRRYSPAERVAAIRYIIENTVGLKILVIDGIRDLIKAINSEEESSDLLTDLMKWSGYHNIHIVTLLHQNPKDVKARGHIGTEIQNKAETVLEVKKGANGLSKVSCLFSRGMDFPSFEFSVVNNIPTINGFVDECDL